MALMSVGNRALLPTNVEQPRLQPGLMNFQLQNFQVYNKSPRISKVSSAPPRKTLRFLGNKVN